MMRALLAQRLRRDWVQLLLWLLGTAALAASSVSGVASAYGDERDRVEVLAAVMANPVIMLFRGLPSGAELDAFTLFLILPFLAMMAAFMSTFLAVRHTRAEEEQGRAELIGATPASRITPLLATMIHGTLANLVLTALVFVSFAGAGYDPFGCLVAGLASGAVGLCFLGVGLASAQLVHTSRAANSIAVWVLLITFLLAGIGNALGTPSGDLQRITSSWLAWLSPFGWAENARPFADNLLWPLGLCVVAALALAAAALALQAGRDTGEALLHARPGRAWARETTFSTPITIVWRQSWGSLLGWAIGGLITGLLATSLGSVLDSLSTNIPAVQHLLDALAGGGGLGQGMVVIFFMIVGLLAACAGVQTVCRARQDEVHGTAELMLSAPVDRVRWLTSYLLIAGVGIVYVAAAGLLGAVLGVLARGTDWSLAHDALVTAGGQALAAAVFVALTALLFVLLPRTTIPLGWTLVMLGILLGLFGALFQLPEWAVNLSPLVAAPTVVQDAVDARGLWWLVGVVVAGIAASLVLMRRRELAARG